MGVRFHNDPIVYRAYGKIKGVYQPSSDNLREGTLVTDDGVSLAATVDRTLVKKLNTNASKLNESLIWNCFPHTQPTSVELKGVRVTPATEEESLSLGVNQFYVVGRVIEIEGQSIVVLIKRNVRITDPAKRAFAMTLIGELPSDAIEQYWQFKVQLLGLNWHVVEAQPAPLLPPSEKKSLGDSKFKQKKATPTSKKIAASAPEPPSSKLAASSSEPIISGQLEITLKINQFPQQVKTLPNQWKEFEIDTGERIVTIALKPKNFAKLEKARQQYPLWLAAISGKIGEPTQLGFNLKEANLQVFQRQPKEPKNAPSSEEEVKNVGEQKSEAAESRVQLSSQESPSPPAPAPQKTGFQVQVNGQTRSGNSKLTFKNRTVQIDGKTVAQSKMVVVIGNPAILETDGTVKKSPDQTKIVIMSR